MVNLIDYALKTVLRLAISEYFQYATATCIIVAILGFIYRLAGKGKIK